MGGHCPVEQTDELVLKDKDDTDPPVKPAKIVGHQGKTESRSLDIG